MTLHTVRVPRVNANDEAVRLVGWNVEELEHVESGQVIARVETTKASVDLESDGVGFLVRRAQPGDMVGVGAAIAYLLPTKDHAWPAEVVALREATPAATGSRPISARALLLLRQRGVAEADIPGSGPIRERDVLNALDQRTELLTDADQLAAISALKPDKASVALFGASHQAEVAIDCLQMAGALRPVILVDDRPRVRALSGLPTVASSHLQAVRARGIEWAHVCIGDGGNKLACAARLREAGFGFVRVVHPTASIASSAVIGEGVFVGPGVIIGPHARIGDFVQLNNASSVAHHSVVGAGSRLSDGARVGGCVTLGERVLLGIGTTVNADVVIGDDTVVVSGVGIFGDVPGGVTMRADGRIVSRQ